MRGWLAPVVLATAIAGCQSAKPTGPAWPAPSTTADDGGESLEPKPTSVATAIEKSEDDDEPAAAAADEPAAKPEAAPDAEKPATISPPTQPASDDDDVIISDEIIIEIDD